jgi:N-acetylglucosamine-6-sulfatase
VLRYAPSDPFWENALEFFGCPNASLNDKCSMEISPCVSERNAHLGDGLANPHTPSWGQLGKGTIPPTRAALQPATPFEVSRQDVGFRNRTGSARDLDDMLGVVLGGIEALGVEDSTYVIFTSDNGYHLSEHRLLMGKENPYSTDVRIPLVIAGPGIPPSTSLAHPTTTVDLTATILELAGASPTGPPLDGLSFAAELTAPRPPSQWRNFSFAENAGGGTTWVQLRRPLPSPSSPSPRTAFHWWCSNVSEVFDLDGDEWQLSNLAGATPEGGRVLAEALPLVLALARCAGQNCTTPVPLEVIPPNPLQCYLVNRTLRL